MKKTLLILAALLCCCFALKAQNYNFSAPCPSGQTLYYRITSTTNHTVKIVAPNEDNEYAWYGYTQPIGQLILPETVEDYGTSYTVTAIGDCSFYKCNGLKGSLVIPNTVTSIEGSAFQYCSGFNGTLTIPNSVTRIGDYAFCGCSGFTGSLTIPNSMTRIEKKAFNGCSNFTGTLTIPSSVTYIADDAFCDCSGFTGSLVIPSSVTHIGTGAFMRCSGFTGSLTIPNSVADIGNFAFNGCSGFTGTLTLPNSLTRIRYNAFSGCSGLTGSLTIPNSVTSIEESAFAGCVGLTGSLIIPNSVTSIEKSAFYECSGFTGSLTIPNSVTSIGDYAFAWCTGFTGSLTIPNSVTSIGERVFFYCSGFNGSLTISSSVTSIGNDAFYRCNGFTHIIARPATPPTLGDDAFYMTRLQTITVPCGKVEAYKTKEGWCKFDDKITGGSFQHNLTVASANPEFGGASITQYSDCTNGSATVAAIPAQGGIFTRWTENGVQVSTDNPYTFELTSDRNLVAHFNFSTSDGLVYNVTSENPPIVTLIGHTESFAALDLVIPSAVTCGSTAYSVTSIREEAFYDCPNLIGSLTIGNAVTSIGNSAFYNCTSLTGTLTIGDAVTSIGDHAFGSCPFTGSLCIPNSVTSIGDYAFQACLGFNGSLTIGSSVTHIGICAFENCSGFTGPLIIPDSVTNIGNYAFSGSSHFTGSLTIGRSMLGIGERAFENTQFTQIVAKPSTPPVLDANALDGMSELQAITVPCGTGDDYGTSSWNAYAIITEAFLFDLTVASANPDFGTAEITQLAICENLQATVTATPAGNATFTGWTENGEVVSTDVSYTFTQNSDRHLVANFFRNYDFSAICETGQTLYYRIIDAEQHWVKIVAPNGDNANGWNGYNKPAGDITLPETVEYDGTSYTVTEINSYAFYKCGGLTGSLAIPNSVTSIGNDAFYKCEGFHGSLTIGNAVTNIGNNAFNQCSGFTGSLTIPNSATSIGNFAFSGCSGFTGSLTIGNAVTNIGNNAFNQCSGFTGSLTIGNAVTSIGEMAFNGCTNFTGTLTISSSVTSIENYAFYNCSGFTDIIAKPATPPDLGNYVFISEESLSLSITVPCGKENDYKASWSTYASLITKDFVYGLTVASANPESGRAMITQQADCEYPQATVSATPNDCYRFYNWTENGMQVSLDNPYTFTLESDRNLVANFTITEQYNFTAICETGQKLYYKIIDAQQHWVSIVPPISNDGNGWNGAGVTKPEGDITLPGTVTYDGISYTVTAIGDYAFYQCYGLTGSLNIPNSVTSIGGHAFYECSGFTGSLIIPDSVTSIGDYAFYDCSGFTGSLAILHSLTSKGAFTNCTGLNGTLFIGSDVTNIGDHNFSWTKFVHIVAKPATPPQTVANLLDHISELQSIFVPSGSGENYRNSWDVADDIRIIEKSLDFDLAATCTTGQLLYYRIIDAEKHWVSIVAPFSNDQYGWEDITQPTGEIELPETVGYNGTTYTVTAIGEWAFYRCVGLTGSLNIPNSVTNIGNFAFSCCEGFNGSLTIGNSVTSIGNEAFYDCSGFTGSLTIGNSVTSIGNSVFKNCSGFTGLLIIPNSVTSIGNSAFNNCSGFTGPLTIGNSVTGIGDHAFWGCSGFTGSLTISSSVERIGDSAFLDCNFTNIISKSQTAPSLASKIPNASSKVYIPKNTTNSYESAWGGYDYIFIEYNSEDYHFNGANGSEWNTAANWVENQVPFLPFHNAFVNAECIFDATDDNATLHSVNVAAGKTLTIAEGNTLTADSITLENGAKLVNNGTIICDDLTVKKAIEGYGTGAGNWYLVSSPVATTSLPVGMKADPADDYDLYRFNQTGDEEGREWLNYKAESFGIENQNGYLYACKNDTTIIFHGDLAATGTKELEYDEGEGVDFPGFNLVGNPYPCNATISGTNLRSSNYYYKMNAAGTDLEVVAEPILAPCTGVFAVAANSDATVTFTQASGAANVTRGEKSSLQDIRVELLADGKVIDRAYLNMNGESLPKFRLQDNASEICFYQNKEELAVASTSSTSGASTESASTGSAGRTEMPLNFKAAKNGSYTITVNVDNADLNYLHLVDNLTGNDVDLMAAAASTGSASYTFEAKTDDYASRFKLVFGVKDDATSAGSAGDFAYISNGEIIVSNEGRATLQVIDVLGRIVSSEQINGECRISTNGLTAGLYILNLDGRTQKIVVK